MRNMNNVDIDTLDMEMPTPCQSCGRWFDLNDGTGSDKWYKDTMICKKCGDLEEIDIQLDDEIENEQNNITDAKWQIDESTKELEKLRVRKEELQQRIDHWKDAD